jgi:hypothetical protein
MNKFEFDAEDRAEIDALEKALIALIIMKRRRYYYRGDKWGWGKFPDKDKEKRLPPQEIRDN